MNFDREYKIPPFCLLIQPESFKKENQLMYIWATKKEKTQIKNSKNYILFCSSSYSMEKVYWNNM